MAGFQRPLTLKLISVPSGPVWGNATPAESLIDRWPALGVCGSDTTGIAGAGGWGWAIACPVDSLPGTPLADDGSGESGVGGGGLGSPIEVSVVGLGWEVEPSEQPISHRTIDDRATARNCCRMMTSGNKAGLFLRLLPGTV